MEQYQSKLRPALYRELYTRGTIKEYIRTSRVQRALHAWYNTGVHQDWNGIESCTHTVQYMTTTLGPEWYRELDTKLYSSP
jgi:hypothetical protein